MGLTNFSNLASEYLECSRCKKKYIGYSGDILKQLDVGHRSLFPAIQTYRYVTEFQMMV